MEILEPSELLETLESYKPLETFEPSGPLEPSEPFETLAPNDPYEPLKPDVRANLHHVVVRHKTNESEPKYPPTLRTNLIQPTSPNYK